MTTAIGSGFFVAAALCLMWAERIRARAHAETSEKARRLARMMLAGRTIRRA